ncbi:hypothetical protein GQ43DRAFT_265304 [Delitschia confertaspora ATCC 74209]|uniref:MIZ/SP-RING zinc finger n=1 Tax=Delitschia confertaspora ATCC 74209 TaxID=1513339 RepID=A0A9P4JQR2_9PLEO|nr:hypothetical protein GQ43DRAFT_265304 [Delitschia confertaspora ATCC 74209]
MAANGRTLTDLAQSLSARSKTLVNADLKKICKEEGEIQGGNKAQLQARVVSIISRYVHNNDLESLERVRYRIHNHGNTPPPGWDSSQAAATTSYPITAASTVPPYAMPNGYGPALPPSAQMTPYGASRFKSSPFYDIVDTVVPQSVLQTSPSHRQSKEIDLILTMTWSDQLRTEPNMRLMLFSYMDQTLGPYQKADVAFPSQIEVKLNGDEVKGNYKGLKNKPGSTRPADITDYVRKAPGYKNRLTITYALTQKKFNVYVYMVKKHPVEELTKRIKQRNVITKQSVIEEMLRKADDPDIVLDSTVMSLKDPISTLRINIPCRSNLCTHNQCFDAESFLQLQEQAPTWQCPVCNKTVSFEGLAVDQYVQEILDSVPKGTEQVTIEPNGKWSQGNKTENQVSRNSAQSAKEEDGSDDDLIEIPDYRVTTIKNESLSTPQSMTRTPPISSRDSSTAPRTGAKRKSEVIDLTLSDDDEPPRPAKKVAYNTPNSLPDSSFRHRVSTFGNPAPPLQQPQPLPQPNNTVPSVFRLDLRPSNIAAPNTQNGSAYAGYRPPRAPRGFLWERDYNNYGSSP